MSSRDPTSRRRDVEANVSPPCQAVEFDILLHDLIHPIDGDQGHSPDSIRTCSNSKELPLPNHLVTAVDDGEGVYLRDWRRRQGVIDVTLLAVLDDSTKLEYVNIRAPSRLDMESRSLESEFDEAAWYKIDKINCSRVCMGKMRTGLPHRHEAN